MTNEGDPCVSDIPHDTSVAICSAWCSEASAAHHCTWCKCAGCSFCAPTSSRTHVYANGGPQMVACDEGGEIPSAMIRERECVLYASRVHYFALYR